jgi:hypothetical protein
MIYHPLNLESKKIQKSLNLFEGLEFARIIGQSFLFVLTFFLKKGLMD